jgi:hypothetical protein
VPAADERLGAFRESFLRPVVDANVLAREIRALAFFV